MADAPARAWEPRTIRLRLMSIPAVIAHHARRTVLRYKADHPWTDLLLAGLGRLQALPAPEARGTHLLPATTLKEEPSGPWKGPTTARRHAASRHTQPA